MRAGFFTQVFALLFVAPMLAPGFARAEGFSVGQLLTNCNLNNGSMLQAKERPEAGKQDTFTALARRLTCLAYIQGAMDMHAVTFGRFGKSSRIYCAKHNVSVKEAAGIVERWAQKSPERGKLPAALGVDAALREAFPCDGK